MDGHAMLVSLITAILVVHFELPSFDTAVFTTRHSSIDAYDLSKCSLDKSSQCILIIYK